MIRLTLLGIFILFLMGLAVRRWYLALCGLVFLTVLNQHPSMPGYIFGIQGLNPWNAVLMVIIIFWATNRRHEPPGAPVSQFALIVFGAYVFMLIAVALAAIVDASSLTGTVIGKLGTAGLIVDGIVNPLKYLIVGVMFFDGARNLQRIQMAMLSAVGSGMCYAFLMFKSMKTGVFTIDYEDARRMTDKLIGLFANDIAQLLAFVMWSAVAIYFLFPKTWQRALWALCLLAVFPPFVALKSRAGFAAFIAIGGVLGVIRWRKLLVILPLAVIGTVTLVPSVRERVLSGLQSESGHVDWEEVSAGRLTNIWPPVLEQIGESPLFGHGRYAILREDCYHKILALERVVPGHPHNAYLEVLLDAGGIGLVVCLSAMGGILYISWCLMRMREDRSVSILGLVSMIAAIGHLTAAMAGNSFYPVQSSVPYLVVWGSALRVYTEMAAARRFATARSPQNSQRKQVAAAPT